MDRILLGARDFKVHSWVPAGRAQRQNDPPNGLFTAGRVTKLATGVTEAHEICDSNYF